MLVVKKFGGSSVADKDGIFRVARRCAEEVRRGNEVLVVLSAMGDTTDKLLALAEEIAPHPSGRELDMLLATGEQVAVSVLAMALEVLEIPSISLNAFQIKMCTTEKHGNAMLTRIDSERILKELKKGQIVIVTGFQGINENEDYTTLGRGGSDITAVALAATFGAGKCEIFTDVDGVYTADPNVEKKARKISEISYDDMLELARSGAKVLHVRAVKLAKKFGVEIVVCSSFDEREGTTVKAKRHQKN